MTAARSQNNTHHIDAASEIAASTNSDRGLVGPDSKCRELTRSDSSRLEAADVQSDTQTRCNVSNDLHTAKTDNSPTRTEDTVASYRARWPSLVRMATGQCGSQPPTLELVWAVAQWLADGRDGYSPNTYRQYRAALLWVVEQMPAVEDGLQGKIESSLKPEEEQNRGARNQPLEARTLAKKRKRIEEEDFSILCEALCASPVASDRDLLVFFEANLMAGLRPSEWEGTALSLEATGDVVLKVANGKATNGRANGPKRTLTFTGPESGQASKKLYSCLSLVERVLEDVDQADRRKVWTKFCRALQDRFRVVNHHLWPRRKRHYTLYSSRHTLLAAAKPTFNSCEVAAIAGHGADATATRHYARPGKGRRSPCAILPAPAEAEVASVRKTLDFERLESAPRSCAAKHSKPR